MEHLALSPRQQRRIVAGAEALAPEHASCIASGGFSPFRETMSRHLRTNSSA